MALVALVARHWLIFVAVTLIAAAAAYAASFLMTPTYRATIVLLPVSDSGEQGTLAGLSGAMGGLAGLAGVSLGDNSNRTEALEVLRSRLLVRSFIEQEGLLQGLQRFKGQAMSVERAVELFQDRILDVEEDKITKVVRVSMTWIDRDVAAKWANRYVALANGRLQARAIKEAAERRQFLRRELERTEVLEVRSAAYRLIESQLKSAMVAATKDEFAYRVLDPAVAPDERDRVRPKRVLIAVAAAALVFATTIVILLLRTARRRTY